MNNNSSTATLIALSGNKRLPHLEEEIFLNKKLTALYLQQIMPYHLAPLYLDQRFGNLTPDIEFYSTNEVCAWSLYLYAKHVMKERWIAAEYTIIRDYEAAVCYATDVIRLDSENLQNKEIYRKMVEIATCQK